MKNAYEAIKKYLLASTLFEVIEISDRRLIVKRLRSIAPRRGIFRLLVPHMHVVVTASKNEAIMISLHPDPLTIFMLIMLLGGVTSEFFMDRLLYPRDYPPEFIYGLAICYIGLLAAEIFYTRKLIRSLHAQIKP